MRRAGRLIVMAAVCSLLTVAGNVSASAGRHHALPGNLVSNGSFEIPIEEGCSGPAYSKGQTLGAWLVASGEVGHDGLCDFQASDGVWTVDLNGNGVPGSISQPLATKVGVTYDVHFAVAANPAGGTPLRTMNVTMNNKVIHKSSFKLGRHSRFFMGWVCPSVDFTATSKKSLLGFASTTSVQSPGPVLDNVSVTPVDSVNVTGLKPATLNSGSSGNVVQVYGANFTTHTVISFSDPHITVTKHVFVNTNHLTLTVNVASNDFLGDSDLTATDSGKSDTCGKSVHIPNLG